MVSSPMRSTTQTTELLVAVAKLTADFIKAKQDDGKIGPLESMKLLLNNAGDLVAGVSGVQEIPAELKDLTPEELDLLRTNVLSALRWAPTPGALAQFDLIYELARHILYVIRQMSNFLAPPKAEVDPE